MKRTFEPLPAAAQIVPNCAASPNSFIASAPESELLQRSSNRRLNRQSSRIDTLRRNLRQR